MQTKWNLDLIYRKTPPKDITVEIEKLKKESSKFIKRVEKLKDYLENPKSLKIALDEYEKWTRKYSSSGAIGYYTWLKTALNQNDPKTKALMNKIDYEATKIANSIQFFELNISKVPLTKQKEFLKSKELSEYKHFLENLFKEGKHLLSDKEEKILNMKSKTSHSNWVQMISELLSKEERKIGKETKTLEEISSLLSSVKKSTRAKANKKFNEIVSKIHEISVYELNSILEDKKINDELRKFKRPDEARHLSDDIETEVVDTLVETVTENFSIAKRYYKLKAKLFKLDKLEYYERNVPYGKIEKEYKYEDAFNLVYKTFENLDSEFSDILKRFSDNGQIDVYPKKGKRSGAFCIHDQITTPTYILLNHTNKLNDVLTLAHETGHGINNELIRTKQNQLNFHTPTSTAEVASTFMEDFVLQEILKTANDNLKLSIMMQKLNSDISTIFRQIACYNFEMDLHKTFREKNYLPGNEIDKLFTKHMSKYMGKYVIQSANSEKWWVVWPHIRTPFYVYSYASGLLISKALQKGVKEDKEYIKKIKTFLSSGSSKSPKEIFKELGIDITSKKFWINGIKEVDKLLSDTEKLAKKLGKI